MDNQAVYSIGNMETLLEIGSDAQKSVILLEMPHLMENCVEETTERILPLICGRVHQWSIQLQIAAAEALAQVTQRALPQLRAKQVCTAAFRVVNASTSEEVFEIWGEILVAALPQVDWLPEELNRVIALLDGHCAAESDIPRKLTARVLGSLSLCIQPEEVEKKILHRALNLSDDENPEVRGMISESLAFIGATVSVDIVENKVWPVIVKLLNDEDERIHAATLRSIAHIVQKQRSEHEENEVIQRKLFTDLLPPVLARECDFSRKTAAEDQREVKESTYLLLEMIAEVYGELVYSVHRALKSMCPKKDAFKAFVAMATCNGPIVRRHCAFNFPGVALSFHSKYASQLSSIVEFLARDTDPETRWILAAGVHEIARTLSEKQITMANIYKAVQNLLKDENPLVRMNVLRNFSTILKEITRHPHYSSPPRLVPLCHNLTALATGTWRMQELLAQQLELCADFIPSEVIKSIVLPVLYQMAEESSHLVRRASMAGVVQCLRNIGDPIEREQAMEEFDVHWCVGSVYWMRIAYVDAGAAAAKGFSKLLFRDLFAVKILRLASDPVANVRLRLAGVLDKLAPSCVQMDEFYEAWSMLKNDEDVDIRGRMVGMDAKIELALEHAKINPAEDIDREQHERGLYRKHVQQKFEEARSKRARHKNSLIKNARKSSSDILNDGMSRAAPTETKSEGILPGDGVTRPSSKNPFVKVAKKLKSDEESPRAISDARHDGRRVPGLEMSEVNDVPSEAQEAEGPIPPASPLTKRFKAWLLSPRRPKTNKPGDF